MIVIEEENDLLKATVYAELTLADFREFETAVRHELKQTPKIKLLLDLTKMSGYTVDVAWEDIRFTRAHARDFRRIAVVTGSVWATWLGRPETSRRGDFSWAGLRGVPRSRAKVSSTRTVIVTCWRPRFPTAWRTIPPMRTSWPSSFTTA